MSLLPDELGRLEQLSTLDISFNAFVSLPRVAYTIPRLQVLLAQKNYIAGN
jgi:Leucine-rich repeat (LRR) protein